MEMKSENGGMFTLELRLRVEPWQSDLLDRRFKYITQVYNTMQSILLRQYMSFKDSPEWRSCKKKSEKRRYLESHLFTVKGFEKPLIFLKQNPKGINAYGVQQFGEKMVGWKLDGERTYKDFGLNTKMLCNVGLDVWSSWDKVLFGKGKRVSFRQSGGSNCFECIQSNKIFYGINLDLEKMLVSLNVNGRVGQSSRFIHLKIDDRKMTDYEREALSGGFDSIRVVRFVRKLIRGNYKYYVQFVIKGKVPSKGRKLGKGRVGIDVGPSVVAISSLRGLSKREVGIAYGKEEMERIENKLADLNRKMDTSRRASNPDNYDAEGKIKKEKGKRLVWKYSKRYMKLKNRYSDLRRKGSAVRKIAHSIMANSVLSLGDTFIVERNPINGWQKRKKGKRLNKKGKIQSNAGYGKSILKHAPSQYIGILQNKVEALGGKFHRINTKNAATQFDFTDGSFTKHSTDERSLTLSDGSVHDRDMLSAFNLQHLLSLGEDDKMKEYDVEQMRLDYPVFCRLEKKEMKRIESERRKNEKEKENLNQKSI